MRGFICGGTRPECPATKTKYHAIHVAGKTTKMKKTGSTFILVKRRKAGDEFLLQLRDDGGGKKIAFPNFWNFPGGKKESYDGDYLSCAIRECCEEFKVTLKRKSCKLLLKYDHTDSVDDHVYVCEVDISQRVTLQEGAGMAWLKLETINSRSFPLAPFQKKIVTELKNNREYT